LTSFFVLGTGSPVDANSKPEGRPNLSGSLVYRSKGVIGCRLTSLWYSAVCYA